VVVALVLLGGVACGGDDEAGGGSPGGGGGGGGGEPPECPLEALDDVTEPVEVVYWHGMTRVAEDALVRLTDQFNAEQDRVRVKLVNNSAGDQHAKYLAGLETGDLPDVIQHDATLLRQMVDTGTVLPAQSCIDAGAAAAEGGGPFDPDDWVARALAYHRVDGVQWALPFGVATPVLVYDRAAFERAGLDPDAPPATLDDYRAAAEALVDAGQRYGAAVAIEAWHFEELLAARGETYVDRGNGREGRATEVTFDSAAGEELYAFFDGLVDDGLAVTNPREGPDAINNLLAIGNGDAAMTVVSSSALGSVLEVLGSGQYEGVELGVAPLFGRTDGGGVAVAGGGLSITARDPAQQAGGWRFVEFLTSPESQSVWAAATGYTPVRLSAVGLPELEEAWAEVPELRVAYDQLVEGAENPATAGPLVGDMPAVRKAVEEALTAMFVADLPPDEALAQAAAESNDAIASYNERLGADRAPSRPWPGRPGAVAATSGRHGHATRRWVGPRERSLG
jgi:sn-glycerol 3-phosphate transport system substrate-binding protein